MELGLFSLPAELATYRAAVDFAKSCGIAAIEPYCDREFREPDVEAAKRLADYAGEQGIAVCCFSMMTHVAAEDNTAEIGRLKKYADVAAWFEPQFSPIAVLRDPAAGCPVYPGRV